MGTNFYIQGEHENMDDLTVHVGKRSNIGGHDMCFTWAMHPERALQLIDDAGGAIDEYGTTFTTREFADEIIKSCIKHDNSAIGKEFL